MLRGEILRIVERMWGGALRWACRSKKYLSKSGPVSCGLGVRKYGFTLSRSQSANLEESTGHIISTPFKIVLMAHTHLVEMRTHGKGTTTAPDVVDAIFGIDKMNVFGTSTSAANACLQTITEALKQRVAP